MRDKKTASLNTTIQFKYFFIISTLFSSTWLISNIAAIKLVSFFGIILTGGFIIFPVTTILSSIIVEVYGYKNARQAIWSGTLLNLSFMLFINLVNLMPSSPHWQYQNEFQHILVPGTRIITASIISFLLSDFINTYLMAKLKIKSQGKSLVKRILISYFFSISIDIIFFMLLAFSGTLSTSLLIKLMAAAYVKKIFCQIAILPLIWYLIDYLKKKEGVEVYDFDTNFNPFSVDHSYDLSAYKQTIKNGASEKPIIRAFNVVK